MRNKSPHSHKFGIPSMIHSTSGPLNNPQNPLPNHLPIPITPTPRRLILKVGAFPPPSFHPLHLGVGARRAREARVGQFTYTWVRERTVSGEREWPTSVKFCVLCAVTLGLVHFWILTVTFEYLSMGLRVGDSGEKVYVTFFKKLEAVAD